MAHQSENAARLSLRKLTMNSAAELQPFQEDAPQAWLFHLPFSGSLAEGKEADLWFQQLAEFATNLNENSLVAFLASPTQAAETYLRLSSDLTFQLWIAVKLDQQIPNQERLPNHQAALLIFSKYQGPLRHAKTRIAYTYCPYCDKTTKDYGGKKHTYHKYGTLMSDVWRDLTYSPDQFPIEISERIADLFGQEPYHQLNVVSLKKAFQRPPNPKRPLKRRPQTEKTKGRASDLIQGDALEELRKIEEETVDFAFADPPYNLSKRYDSWDDAIEMQEYLDWCDNWLDELARVLKPGRTCAVLNIPFLAVHHFHRLKRSLEFQNWIAWEALSLPVRMIMPAHYAIVCFSKGKPRPPAKNVLTLREWFCVRASCVRARQKVRTQDTEPVSDLWWDIHRLKHNSRRVDHPCQLPPALMKRLISLFTSENELVLDPFNGAGTTTLCAADLGRNYVGIELSEAYHSLATNRHAVLRSGGDPFAKKRAVPKSKNSRVNRIGDQTYQVPKRTLQLEVRRVAQQLGRLPTREELCQYGQYPIHYYDEYFISWGEVCAAARTTGMSENRSDDSKPAPQNRQKQLPFSDD